MEIWIIIGILLASGFIGCTILEIYDNIQMNRWMRQRHLRELRLAMRKMEHPEFFSRTHDVSADEIKRAAHAYKTLGVTTHLPTGEVEVLGPGKVYFEENEAEKLLKEAKEKQV